MGRPRLINHPGVEIGEIDKSQNPPTETRNTVVLGMGFASRGESCSPKILNSVADFQLAYGTPTNEAERYLYYGSKNVFDNGGSMIVARIPYETGNSKYDLGYQYTAFSLTTSATLASTALGLSATPFGKNSAGADDAATTTADFAKLSPYLNGDTSYYGLNVSGAIGTSYLETSAYNNLLEQKYTNTALLSTTASAYTSGFVVVMENKNILNGAKNNDGFLIVVTDFYDAINIQGFVSPSANLDSITGIDVNTGANVTPIVSTEMYKKFVDNIKGDSVSEDVISTWPAIELNRIDNDTTHTATFKDDYKQYLGIHLLKVTSDPQTGGYYSVGIVETFIGSINPMAKDVVTGRSNYLGDLINNSSSYIKFFGPSVSVQAFKTVVDSKKPLICSSKSYDLIGFVNNSTELKKISSTNIAASVDKVLEQLSNIDDLQIDVVADFGLSNIAQEAGAGDYYGDGNFKSGQITNRSDISTWIDVGEKLKIFCQTTRKDCMAILDVPRRLALEGAQKCLRKTRNDRSFNSYLAPQFNYLNGFNSSYAALYSVWMQAYDDINGVNFWIPETCNVAGVYCYTDRNANFWDAPAGLNRGVISNVTDIAFNPKSKEADLIYSKNINYANFYQNEGYVIEGQKTTQIRSSAFDRVNVRRSMLRMERFTYKVARYFVYEPNNLYTRRSLFDTLNPYFADIKNRGGLYDYKIVCDETNNTPDVIDRNELRVLILVKPVRTAEYVIVDFAATRTGADFNEVLKQLL